MTRNHAFKHMSKYNRKDQYYKKAKEEGYRSRASYKLLDLDKKHRLFKKGMHVLDLGCFPGGWLQVAAEKVTSSGKVIGVDLDPLEPFREDEFQSPDFSFPQVFCADIREEEAINIFKRESPSGYHVLLSDMSPKLSGIRLQDMARIGELVESVFALATHCLKKGGTVVTKTFPSEEADRIFKEQKKRFKSIRRENLASSRSSSNEYYIVAKGFIGK